jgi:hypothetical protein
MADFIMQDRDNSWDDFTTWLVSMDVHEYNRVGFKYYAERIYDQTHAAFGRVFMITIKDESAAAFFRLRWNDYLLDKMP